MGGWGHRWCGAGVGGVIGGAVGLGCRWYGVGWGGVLGGVGGTKMEFYYRLKENSCSLNHLSLAFWGSHDLELWPQA